MPYRPRPALIATHARCIRGQFNESCAQLRSIEQLAHKNLMNNTRAVEQCDYTHVLEQNNSNAIGHPLALNNNYVARDSRRDSFSSYIHTYFVWKIFARC